MFKRSLPPLPSSLVFSRTVLKFFSVSPLRVGNILVSAVRQESNFGFGFSRWTFTYVPFFFFFWVRWIFVEASWLVHESFLVLRVGTTLYGSGVPASHCGGFSCCAEWVLGLR